jgi:hypothetical protein
MKPDVGGKPVDGERLLILQRRVRVAEAYMRHKLLYEIAKDEGVSRTTISDDLAAIRKEWLNRAVAAFDQRRAEELARIDRLEAEAWDAWERSKRDAQTIRASTTKGRVDGQGKPLPDLVRTDETLEGQVGDPRFLERIGWCIQKRCEITGILTQAAGASCSVVVMNGIDLAAVIGQKPGLPHDRLGEACPN